MKKVAACFVFLGFLFSASSGSAAYVILLKDGRSITTHEYREEGGRIKIEQYGGVVSISKDDVLSIEETDDVKILVVKSPPEKKSETADEKIGVSEQMEGKEATKGPEEADKEKSLKRDESPP